MTGCLVSAYSCKLLLLTILGQMIGNDLLHLFRKHWKVKRYFVVGHQFSKSAHSVHTIGRLQHQIPNTQFTFRIKIIQGFANPFSEYQLQGIIHTTDSLFILCSDTHDSKHLCWWRHTLIVIEILIRIQDVTYLACVNINGLDIVWINKSSFKIMLIDLVSTCLNC